MELWRENIYQCTERKSEKLSNSVVWCFVGKNAHLISGVGHVEFGTFLRAFRVSQLHVEQVEDKTVKSRAQTVAEAPNSCNHTLDNTYRETARDTQYWCQEIIRQWPVKMTILLLLKQRKSTFLLIQDKRHQIAYTTPSIPFLEIKGFNKLWFNHTKIWHAYLFIIKTTLMHAYCIVFLEKTFLFSTISHTKQVLLWHLTTNMCHKTHLVGLGLHYGTRWRWWQGKWCWTLLRLLQLPKSSCKQQHPLVKDTNKILFNL